MDQNRLFYFSFYYLFCLGVIYWYGVHWLECGVLPPLQHSAALCSYLTQLWNFPLNYPCNITSSIGSQPDLSYYNGIKTGYFYCIFYAYDQPTVAGVNLSSSAAYIAALRSGLLCQYPGLHCRLETIQKSKHCLLKVNIGTLNISLIKAISIISYCVILYPANYILTCFKYTICRFKVSKELAL